MKEITLEDCNKLRQDFDSYVQTSEQHEFPLLLMIDMKMTQTDFKELIKNQAEARAMFRVVKKTIGQDASEYEEN